MDNIEIRRPKEYEIEKINDFFEIVLIDTFKKNGIFYRKDLYNEEILSKKNYLLKDFETNGIDRYFLIAFENEKVVGSVEYGEPNNLINELTNNMLKDVIEIGTVFVHPEYQRKGIGSSLIKELSRKLLQNGEKEFCLDSGYKTAQKTWTSKFGVPKYMYKDKWGKDAHHMIWRVSLEK